MKNAPILAMLLVLVACNPHKPSVSDVVVARFDPAATPAVAPAPNDLAVDPATGLLAVPVAADAPAAAKELTAYLNTLNGFPASMDAMASFAAPLDASTVTLANVRVYDVTEGWRRLDASRFPEPALLQVEDPDDAEAPAKLVVRAPVGGWTPGHAYAIGLVGGEGGLRGAAGAPVVASLTFSLVRSATPLAACTDGKYHADGAWPDCWATSSLFPAEATAPEAKAVEQATRALAAEGVRRQLAPVLDALQADGVPRADVALAWSFRITDQTVARFDPTAGITPTPTDLVADAATGLLTGVAANLSATASAADREVAKYLGTLDGYPRSTAGTVSFSAKLDPTTVARGTTVRVVDLSSDLAEVRDAALAYVEDRQGFPKLTLTPPAGGWIPGHRYAVALVGGAQGLQDTRGRPVIGSTTWALLRSRSALLTCDASSTHCAPTVDVFPATSSVMSERRAQQLAAARQAEGLRQHYQPMLEKFEAAGIARETLALAFSFRVSGQVSLALDPKAACPVAPSPNDLSIDPVTGRVDAPLCDSMSPAYREFITTHLNTLDGFPTSATAHAPVANGELSATSVTASTVRVLDVTAAPAPVATTLAWDAATRSIVIPPPATGWTKGHRYAIAVVAGANGVKDASGKAVVGSDVFALLRSPAALLTCTDLADQSCASTLTLSTVELADLRTLEAARRSLAPLFAALEAGTPSLPRADLAMLWTFRIVSEPEFVFDPASGIVPFPSAFAFDAATGRVALPTAGLTGAKLALVQGLNTLDGFSTTVPAVSENSAAKGALDVGAIDPATLGGHAAMLDVSSPTRPVPWKATVQAATATAPEQLQFAGPVPLDEGTQYAAYLTTGVKDVQGRTVHASTTFALLRSTHPLVDERGESLIPDLPKAQAAQLEAIRVAHAPLLQGLASAGIPREQLGLVWTFKTQTTLRALQALHALPGSAWATRFPAGPAFAVDGSSTAFAQMEAKGMPHDAIGKVHAGRAVLPWALTGPGGTLGAPVGARASFLLVTPKTAAASGMPVVIFQHDFQRQRQDALAVANGLASAGFAVFALDAPGHGDRTSCTGSGAWLSKVLGTQVSDDAACADPATQRCDTASGLCVSRNGLRAPCGLAATVGVDPDLFCTALGQGNCVMTDASETNWKCQAADLARTDGVPKISGWSFIDLSNPFATRDVQRQYVLDLAQVERLLASSELQDKTGTLDAGSLHFLGQGVGAMLGTLYSAASPNVQRVVLNAPGTDVLDLVLGSPAFAPMKAQWMAGLTAQGIVPGTPEAEQFLGFAKWIAEAGAAQTASKGLLRGMPQLLGRAVLVQRISDDEVVPNALTDRLLASTNSGAAQCSLDAYTGAAPAAPNRHGFLLNGADLATTMTAQSHAAVFLKTGRLP